MAKYEAIREMKQLHKLMDYIRRSREVMEPSTEVLQVQTLWADSIEPKYFVEWRRFAKVIDMGVHADMVVYSNQNDSGIRGGEPNQYSHAHCVLTVVGLVEENLKKHEQISTVWHKNPFVTYRLLLFVPENIVGELMADDGPLKQINKRPNIKVTVNRNTEAPAGTCALLITAHTHEELVSLRAEIWQIVGGPLPLPHLDQ